MACNYETLGAHIRNALTPYNNVIAFIKDMKEAEDSGDTKKFEIFKKMLYKSSDNLQHLIDISKMPEVEAINWRQTELGINYLNSLENE